MPMLRACSRCGRLSADDGHNLGPCCRPNRAARPHHTKAWARRREQVRKARGDRCEDCGCTNAEHLARTGKSLGVNHLNGDANDWRDENLRVQCYACHNSTDAARRRLQAARS